MRCGIFAIKPIRAGTEITYDYQLSAKSEFVCLCKSANCRGTMKARSPEEANRTVVNAQKKWHEMLQEKFEKRGRLSKRDIAELQQEIDKIERRKLNAAKREAPKK